MFIILLKSNGINLIVIININNIIFNKIAKGTLPIPRAAHAACSFNENQLVIYGGATGCKIFMIN